MSVDGTLLLVLPVPFRHDANGELMFEAQACNGLDRWADNFARIVVACPVLPGVWREGASSTSAGYLPTRAIAARDRIEFVELPPAYTLLQFTRHMTATKRLLAGKIGEATYLSFAIGGLFGDWGAVAATVASSLDRRYSVWTDRVEHRVVKTAHQDARGLRRVFRQLKNNLVISPLMRRLELRVIRRAQLGLFHGRDCFDAYAPHCRNAHLVHDIHLKARDRIDDGELRVKQRRREGRSPLKIVYAGRAAEMKGVLDWIEALAELARLGVAFDAVWMGDGPLLDEARAAISGAAGLASTVQMLGNVDDRVRVLAALRDADLFVFCHKTPESPRCLIEALMSGTPIVGYDSAYPRDLLGSRADDCLVPVNDPHALARRIASFAEDRSRLCDWFATAADIGSHFSDDAVFRHRSDLIKQHLP